MTHVLASEGGYQVFHLGGAEWFWLFFSAGTNVGFTLTAVDTQTGAQRTYTNPDINAAVPVQDTAAFACP